MDGNRTHQEPRKRPLNGFEGRGTHQVSGHPRGVEANASRAAFFESTNRNAASPQTVVEHRSLSGARAGRSLATLVRNFSDRSPRKDTFLRNEDLGDGVSRYQSQVNPPPVPSGTEQRTGQPRGCSIYCGTQRGLQVKGL